MLARSRRPSGPFVVLRPLAAANPLNGGFTDAVDDRHRAQARDISPATSASELARAEAFSRATGVHRAAASPVKLDGDELELIDRLVRHDRTAVSTALLAIAGIGAGEARRRGRARRAFDEAARAAQAEGAISSSRADQIARHVGRALGHVEQAARGLNRWSAERPGRRRGGLDERLFAHTPASCRRWSAGACAPRRANVEDACGFAWLQLVRHRPSPAICVRVAVHDRGPRGDQARSQGRANRRLG